jgi:hypothetical protein
MPISSNNCTRGSTAAIAERANFALSASLIRQATSDRPQYLGFLIDLPQL